jgi:hypothetical protein
MGVVVERAMVRGRWQSALVVIMRVILVVRRVVWMVRVIRGVWQPVVMVVPQITTHVRVARPAGCRW